MLQKLLFLKNIFDISIEIDNYSKTYNMYLKTELVESAWDNPFLNRKIFLFRY